MSPPGERAISLSLSLPPSIATHPATGMAKVPQTYGPSEPFTASPFTVHRFTGTGQAFHTFSSLRLPSRRRPGVGGGSTIRVIRHATNQGIGQSIRDGIAAAAGAQFMVVPGDNAVTPDLIVALLSCRDRADAILSVPFNKEMRGRRRNFLSMQYQAIYMVAFNVHVGYINGPGLWPTARARALALRSRRFSIISELNVKLLRSGGTYAEVPGQVKGGQKTRSTVTLQNMSEVIGGFARLVREVYFSDGKAFQTPARRVPIDFAPLPAAVMPVLNEPCGG